MKKILPIIGLLMMGATITPNPERGGTISVASGSPGAGVLPPTASPTALQALMATAVGRWKASDAACNGTRGDCSDGQDVETLHDSSSGGNNFTQATAAAKPTWDADCGGNESFGCMVMDSNDSMAIGSSGALFDSVLTGSDATFAMLVVYIPAGTPSGTEVLAAKSNATGSQYSWEVVRVSTACPGADENAPGFQWSTDGASSSFKRACGALSSSTEENVNTVDVSSFFVNVDMTESVNETAVDGRINRYGYDSVAYSPDADSTTIFDSTADVTIGERASGAASFVGRFVEFVIWDDELSAAEITTLNTYLKDTYNIVRPPPGYVADWRADQAACSGTQGDCANGETAETLHDIGSGGNNFTNATGTDVPTYVAAGPNSQPAIDFDGTDDYFDAGDVLDTVWAGTDSDFAIVGVYRNEADQNGDILSKYVSGSQSQFFIDVDNASCPDSSVTFLTYFNLAGTSYAYQCGEFVSRNSDYHSFLWNYDGSVDTNGGLDRYTVKLDRFDFTSTSTGSGGSATDIVDGTGALEMGRLGGGSTYLDGKISELLVYPAPLTAAQITGLNEYLKERYDIVRPPPGYAWWIDGQDIDADGADDVDGLSGGQIYGKGSSADTLIAGGGVSGPEYDTDCDALPGFACVNGNGTDDYWTGSNTAMNVNPATFCLVVSVPTTQTTTDGDDGYPILASRNSTSGTTGPKVYLNTSSQWVVASNTNLTSTETGAVGTLYMIAGTSGASASLRINGAATDISGNSGTTDFDRSGLFRDFDAVAEFWNGSWVEGIVWDGDIFASTDDCETYFQERYGTEFWAQ